jgi:hypothetical protein
MRFFDWVRSSRMDDEREDNSTPAPVLPQGEGRIDPRSDTWAYVTHHAQQEIARLRERNDSNKWDAIATAEIRGQIKALKKMLTLGTPKADRRRLSVEDED